MQKRPNEFDGFTYTLTNPADIEKLDPNASILLEPGQIDFIENYPTSLAGLVKKAAKLTQIPNLPKWLASLWNKPLTLEVHTSSELYNMNYVWLRFHVQDENLEQNQHAWDPAINLLSIRPTNRLPVPELLLQVFNITGEINHHGYGVAGRLHHPDRVGNEVAFYETLKNDKVFYRLPEMTVFWEFHGASYTSDAEREAYGLHQFDQGLPNFLNRYFGSLLEKKELQINPQVEK